VDTSIDNSDAGVMKIAGTFRANQWPAMRMRLQTDDADAWREAVTLLRNRLGGRYLEHASALLNCRYSGFAILAIDSAVIEALEQFRKGVHKTPAKKSGEFFRDFFTATRFKAFFTPELADLFYRTVRCGILHQAESAADSLVKKSTASFVVKRSPSGKGVVINARRFHEELDRAFDDYVNALLTGDAPLRTSFIKKMNYITRSSSDDGAVV
jgi:hypothetical protein